jgi:8-oxo-dGTP pyrophosphatase MutT (NUDIX family)/transcriptional regulator with XRE-family HTH domain
MHDVIARGVAAARQRKRWTQERAAREFRHYGLTTWRTSTVGSLEAGLRRPRFDEVLLMAAALGVSLDELIPGDDERVDLGDGAAMTPRAIRALLRDHDEFAHFPIGDTYYPGRAQQAELYLRSQAQRDKIEPLLEPLVQWAQNHGAALTGADWDAAFMAPEDAERHAARRLGVHPAQVRFAARVLHRLGKWQQDFSSEREARIGDAKELAPRSLQARRGLVARGMLEELNAVLSGPATQMPVVAAIVTSRQGVLIGRRVDGKPPWTFIAGEQDVVKDENPADTAVREVKEETGLRIRPGDVIGERVHPKTNRRMIYLAATPTRSTSVFVNDEAELTEVKWASLDEALRLLPDMFPPVRQHLERTLGSGAGD